MKPTSSKTSRKKNAEPGPSNMESSSSVGGVKYTGMPPTSWDNTIDKNDIMWGPPLANSPERRKAYRAQVDRWLRDPYTLDERWAARAKQELNEEPSRMHDEVAALRGLVAAVKGLKSRLDDHFLLAFLRSKRHDVDTAFTALLKYYRMRKLNPKFFELCLPSAYPEKYTINAVNIMEGYDNFGRPICYFSADFHPSAITNCQYVQLIVHLLDFLVIDPRAQVSGLTILVNLEKQSMAHTKLITVKFLKLMLQIFQGSFPVRMKLIFLCHGSFLFRATYAVLKPFIPEKFKGRIFILGSQVDKVLDYIPPPVLPPELMGTGGPVRRTSLSERIEMVEDLMQAWHPYGYADGAEMTRQPSMQFDDEEIPITDTELQRRITQESALEEAKHNQDKTTN